MADHIGGTIVVRCTRLNKKKIVRRPLKCCGPLLLFLTYDSLGIVSSSDVRDQDECSNSHRIQRHIVRDYRNSDMYVGITSLDSDDRADIRQYPDYL